jgi:peptidyl-prolyl cis-trans isomerase B (cyclophilin B)
MQLKNGTDYQLVLTTNCGEIVIDTFADKAPETVNAMLWLAGEGYFDSTLCHRVVTEGIKVLQCGDPTATGTGGPGFTIPDENLPAEEGVNYPAGTVAMANAGPGTSGSQFFLVYEDTTLPPNYTIWGEVSSGLDVVTKIAEAGVAGGATDGTPAAPIGIETAVSQEA